MSRNGWLLVRQQGALWGLQRSDLGNLSAAGRSSWIELANGETFEVDEILTLVPQLESHPLPLFATLFVEADLDGLAVWNDQPVALLAPGASLPDCFRQPGEVPTNPEPSSYDA